MTKPFPFQLVVVVTIVLERMGGAQTGLVVEDDTGRTVASAYGVPPEWVTDISGTEVWVAEEAAVGAFPGCLLRMDSEPYVDAFHREMRGPHQTNGSMHECTDCCWRHGTTWRRTQWHGCLDGPG